MDVVARICQTMLFILTLKIRGCSAPSPSESYSTNPPIFVWPLGDGIGHRELMTGSAIGISDQVTYDLGPAGTMDYTMDYNATRFKSSDDSYVDVPVEYSDKLNPDYSLSFYIFVEADGVFVHYRSITAPDNLIDSLKLEAVAGDINITLTNAEGNSSTSKADVNMAYDTWYRLVLERDNSHDKMKLYNWATDTTAVFDSWVKGTDTWFPGTIRFGGSFEGDFSFGGALSCVQLVDSKYPNPISDYDNECKTANWPPTTTTSTTSSTTSTTPPTTNTVAATTSMTTHTTTTSLETTSTSTTTTTQPTTTTTTPTSTTAPTSTTKTTPSTTSVQPTTPANSDPTTTAPGYAVLPSRSPPPLVIGSSHFTVLSNNATYQQLSQVLGSSVSLLYDCVWKCVMDGACLTFAFKPDWSNGTRPVLAPGMCLLGISSPDVIYDGGSTTYRLV